MTSYTRLQCDYQESVPQIFQAQDTVEVVGDLFGAFAVFLQHFEVSVSNVKTTNFKIAMSILTHQYLKVNPNTLNFTKTLLMYEFLSTLGSLTIV